MCLKVLNISNNKITSFENLIGFHELNTLEAKNNLLNNMDDLTRTISTLTSLKDLFLQGNPVTQSYRYRENLIANSVLLGKIHVTLFLLLSCSLYNYHFVLQIANLDGKIVTDTCRNFMKKFKMEKHNRHMKKAIKTPLASDITSMLTVIAFILIAVIIGRKFVGSLNLPPAFKRSISRAIFQNPGSQLSIKITPESIGNQQVFPPWKSVKQRQK